MSDKLRRAIERIVHKFEDGENHDEGAFDAECEICRILQELRTALAIKPTE